MTALVIVIWLVLSWLGVVVQVAQAFAPVVDHNRKFLALCRGNHQMAVRAEQVDGHDDAGLAPADDLP